VTSLQDAAANILRKHYSLIVGEGDEDLAAGLAELQKRLDRYEEALRVETSRREIARGDADALRRVLDACIRAARPEDKNPGLLSLETMQAVIVEALQNAQMLREEIRRLLV
jgi:hypothetical protein